MFRIVTAFVVAGAATVATAQTPDPHTVLMSAAEAMLDVHSASYDARLEMEALGGQNKRVVTGKVYLSKNDFSDLIGASVAIRGKISGTGMQAERFEAAYDGSVVRRLMPESHVMLQADLGYGGEELLRGSFGALVMRNIVDMDPYSEEFAAPELVYVGKENVAGTNCDVIEARYPQAMLRWAFGADDNLPRRRERRFRAAQGNEVQATLTIRNLVVNSNIDPAIFEIEVPDGVRVETVGKKPPPTINVGDLVPDWTLTDVNGNERTLSDMRGKVVVMDFWATWCPHCRDAMPAMQKLHDAYADRGLEVLGINCRERLNADPAGFVRDQGVTYPILLGGNQITMQYRVQGIPAFFVIDREGRLVHNQWGFSDPLEARLKEVIERCLAAGR